MNLEAVKAVAAVLIVVALVAIGALGLVIIRRYKGKNKNNKKVHLIDE